jgi:DNA helicase-2/ATP-dependent DNA helicase PcrA
MLDGLNDQQRTAVTTGGNVLLTACPGSGKTRVLTYKVAYELQRIVGKKLVVALTFTNRASDEIKRRLDHMDIDAEKLWTGTIHAFCLEWILRPYGGYLKELKNGFVIADEYKTEELLSGLKEDFGFRSWDRFTTRLNTDGTFAELDPRFHRLLENYHQILRDEGLIDFDQMLYFAYKILAKHHKIPKTLNNLFHIILVDEYQDTQDLQYQILAKIIRAIRDKTTIFMVGDRDQAIYGSLGGVARTLEEVKREFNIEMVELKLSGNYRSTQRAIDYYRNYQTADIEIESKCDYAAELGHISFNSEIHMSVLAEHIASIITENLEAGIPEKEICVLAPQWWMVIPMGRKLKQLLPDVNFDAVGLSPLVKNKENIWFKVARLFLVDPAPNMYFVRSRWANELLTEFEGVGIYLFSEGPRRPKQLLRLLNSIKSDKENGLEYLEECFLRFIEITETDMEVHPNLNQHWSYFFEGTKKRLENPEYNYATDILSFKRLFRHNCGVVVNTCHGIKGEEFHTVIAFGLLHGYIPNWNEADAEAAAKKLLYVICSRAKKHLHLIAELGHTTRSGNPYNITGQLQRVEYDYD